MLHLGIDVGTTSMKLIAVDDGGEVRGFWKHEYTERKTGTGGAFLKGTEIAAGLRGLLLRALASFERGERMAASVSVLGEAVCARYERDELDTELLLPMDYQGAGLYEDVARRIGIPLLQATTGNPFHPMFSLSKMLWMKAHGCPDRKRIGFLDALSFVNGFLTGETVTDHSTAARTQVFDVVKREWSRPLIHDAGLDDEALPRVGASGDFVGYLRRDRLGLGGTGDIPVFLGGFDQACAALGNGVTGEGTAFDNVGTTVCVGICRDAYSPELDLQSLGFQWTPGVMTTAFFLNGGSLSGGIVLDWCSRFLGGVGIETGTVELWLSRIPDEPSSLRFLPYLTGASAPYPDPNARARIEGIGLETTGTDLFSAALDSVNFESRLVMETAEERLGRIERVVVSGSPRRSPRWLRKKAAVYGRPVQTTKTLESSAFGAAMIAALALNQKLDRRGFIHQWCAIDESIEPDAALARLYEHRFREYADTRRSDHVSVSLRHEETRRPR